MKVMIVGGVFGRDEAYRRSINPTPEMTLAAGLEARGVDVVRAAHEWRHPLRGIDLVHVHHLAKSVPALAAGRLARTTPPLVFTRHGEEAHRPLQRTAALALVHAAADAFVALSHQEAARLRGRVRGRVHVVRNGIAAPPGPFERTPHRPLRLLYVGQLIHLKNVDVLLRAVAAARPDVPAEVRLVFHNDHLRDELAALAADLGITGAVTFVGPRAPQEMLSEYRAADALVLPSSTESLPSVVTEALLCELPVVASAVGGIPEQLAGSGLLVPPGDADALAAALRELAARQEELISAARTRAAAVTGEYTVDAMIDGHLAVYDDVLAAPRGVGIVRGRSRG